MRLQWQKSSKISEHEGLRFQPLILLLVSCIFALSLSAILASIFYLNPLPWFQGIALSAAILLLCEGMARKPSISFPIVLLLLIGFALFFLFDSQFQKTIIDHLIGFRDTALLEANNAWYERSAFAFTGNNRRDLFLLVVALITLVSFFIVRSFKQASMMLLLLVITAAQAEFQQLANILLPVSLSLFCAIFILSQSNQALHTRLRLPITRVVLLLVISVFLNAVLAPNILYNADLDRFLRQAENRVSSGTKTSGFYEFSLNSAGYYPKTSELGGAVTLSDLPFAEVKGDAQAFYLRGAVYGVYTGKAWVQEGMDAGLLFDDSQNAALKQRTFLIDPPQDAFSSILRTGNYHFKPLLQPQQSILIAGVADQIAMSSQELPIHIYFNQSGSVYADNNIPDEGYEVAGKILNIASVNYEATLNNLLAFPSGNESGRMSEAERAHWLGLPLNVSSELLPHFLDLTTSIDATHDDALTWAVRIKEALSSSLFTYSLDVPDVPTDREFVDWFLEQRTGYCTYFATALTVLCRQAGIPARYVEGYVVPAIEGVTDGTYTRTLTGMQAHAWTEVWIEDVGWLALDATPAGYQNQLTTSVLDEEIQETPSTTTTQSTETEEVQEEPTSPSTTIPTTASAESAPSNQETESEEPIADPLKLEDILPYLILLLILSACGAYYKWRTEVFKKRHKLEWQLERHAQNTRSLVLAVWSDMRHLAELNALKQNPEQTIRQYVMLWPEDIRPIQSLASIEQAVYGATKINMPELEVLMTEYWQLESWTKETMNRPLWIVRRFLFS